MQLRKHKPNQQRNHSAWLYFFVFRSSLSGFFVVCLFTSFLLQPFHKTLAAPADGEALIAPEPEMVAVDVREQPNTAPPGEASVSEETEETPVEPPATSEATEPEVPVTEDAVSATPVDEELENDVPTLEEIVLGTTTSESTGATATSGASNNELLTNGTSTLDSSTTTNETTATSSPASMASTSSQPVSVANTDATADESNNPPTPGAPASVATSSGSTTTDSGILNPVVMGVAISEENYYQFSKQSCVEVGNDTYHCSRSPASSYDSNTVVFSAVGKSGTQEIFLETSKGEIEQLTDNAFDDTAPYLDADSMQIVWQREINGRFQIIVYDIADASEKQLTFSRTNNMEPKISSDGVVWQAWDNNDWEIMYFDGTYTEQVTDNLSQDVAPVIKDGFILWSVLGEDVQQARVYSIESGETITIQGHDGGKIVNPRFVLVYDTQFDNGDVVTQGFDPSTGISKPITAEPAPQPINIPDSDPVGETIALIQFKPSTKDEKETLLEPDTEGDPNATSTASTTTSEVLDLSATATSTPTDTELDVAEDDFETTTTTSTTTDFTLTEYDVVIAKTGEVSTSTEVAHDEVEWVHTQSEGR